MVNNFLKKNQKKIIIFYLSLTIFIVDRLSKYLVLYLSGGGEKFYFPITSFVDINLVWNKGIAFGLFSFNRGLVYNIITSIIVVITLVVLLMAYRSSNIERIGYSMIFGGSLGNIFDRFYYNSVLDFIDLHINDIHWFIFNIADVFICSGVIILIILEFKKKQIT